MTLGTAKVTGVLFGLDGNPVQNCEITIKPTNSRITGVTGGALVPDILKIETNSSGKIGTRSNQKFMEGVNLPLGKYEISVSNDSRRMHQTITIDNLMVMSGSADLQDTMEDLPVPLPVSRGLPAGGNTGQVLTKASGDDYAAEWTTVSGAGGSGSGTVTQIIAGAGLTGGTITESGVISLSEYSINGIEHANTAFGWGNHSTEGYLKSIPAHTHIAADMADFNSAADARATAVINAMIPTFNSETDTRADARIAASDKISSSTITQIVTLTQAEYDLLTPDATTLYVITE